MPAAQSQQGQPQSHSFQPLQAEGRASGMAAESPGQLGMDRELPCICSCVSEPRGNGWRLPSSSGVFAHPRLVVFVCLGALLAGQCWSTRVLLGWWRSGEVLVAGAAPEGLANTCSVAVLQGPVMDKQLDKLPFFFFSSCL